MSGDPQQDLSHSTHPPISAGRAFVLHQVLVRRAARGLAGGSGLGRSGIAPRRSERRSVSPEVQSTASHHPKRQYRGYQAVCSQLCAWSVLAQAHLLPGRLGWTAAGQRWTAARCGQLIALYPNLTAWTAWTAKSALVLSSFIATDRLTCTESKCLIIRSGKQEGANGRVLHRSYF